jgi:hypothetical protein
MAFKPGKRIRLTQDLNLGDKVLKKGSVGTVTTHVATIVRFDDHPQELAISNAHLEEVGRAVAEAASLRVDLPGDRAGFAVGQRVRLLIEKQLGSEVLPAGSLGIVTRQLDTINASMVRFDGGSDDKLIPNSDLAAA